MSEESTLISVALLVVAIGCLMLFIVWRVFFRGKLNEQRWALRLSIYFAAYNLGWLVLSLFGIRIFHDAFFVLNPVYAVALHYSQFFERILHHLPSIFNFTSQSGGIIFLMFYVLVMSTGLWAILGMILGFALDIWKWKTRKQLSPTGNA